MESEHVKNLFEQLEKAALQKFPESRKTLEAPTVQGVYIIRDPENTIVQVGRTYGAENGIYRRLQDHLYGRSSFAENFFGGKGHILRAGFTFQCITIENDRQRALLEHFATAYHCPKYLGVNSRQNENLNT